MPKSVIIDAKDCGLCMIEHAIQTMQSQPSDGFVQTLSTKEMHEVVAKSSRQTLF